MVTPVDPLDREKAVQELLTLVGEFSRLIDRQVHDAREIMLKTVDQMMSSVNAISDASDFKKMKAEELLVKKGEADFVSKSAKEIDASMSDPASKIKVINEQISAHMGKLSDLDENVKSVLFSIMGALSMDDVVRQRLEHVTSANHAMEKATKSVIQDYIDQKLVVERVKSLTNEMAVTMYKSFTTEEEKNVFKVVLGEIKNYKAS